MLFWLTINPVRQYRTLREAWRINLDFSGKIGGLKKQNEQLVELIREATDSNYLDKEVRDKLGVGTKDDYWLILPTEDEVARVPGRTFEVKKRATWQEWWDWLTIN